MENQNDMQTRLVPGVGRLPYPAYRGNEPYIFISYAHDDKDIVFPEIKRFNEAGFHVWYDEGISPGNEWTDEIADALERCCVFVVMITPVSAPRKNVLNEINFALDENKSFLAIHLEKTELKGGLKLRIGSTQAILKYNMTEEEYEYKYIEAFTRLGLRKRSPESGNADEIKEKRYCGADGQVSKENSVKTACEKMLDQYADMIRQPIPDNQAKEKSIDLEEKLVKEFHTLGSEGKIDILKSAYVRLEHLLKENPFTKMRLEWVRNRAKSDYAYVLSIKSDLPSKEESVRLFEELMSNNPSHTGYADNIRIIKTQIAGYYLKMAEKGDSKAALHAEELYEELAKQNPDRDYQQFIQKAATFVATYRNEKDADTNGVIAKTPSPIIAGTHSFGDYVPKGTAVITNGLGKEFTAIGNSLVVYKPVGAVRFQTLHDLVFMERTTNGYVLKDTLGREIILKTSPGDELLFLSAEEKTGLGFLDPEKLQINMVKSIRVDPGKTPDRKIRYCDIRLKDGSFLSPREFLFFLVNEANGAPPVMKLKKDLNKFSGKGQASLLMMKKLTVTKVGEGKGPYGDHRALDITVEYPGNDTESFTIDDYFAIYAMGANGEVHQLKREELKEIEIL